MPESRRKPGRQPITPDEARLQKLREARKRLDAAQAELDRLIVDAIGHANQDAIADAAGVKSVTTVWRKKAKAKEAKARN